MTELQLNQWLKAQSSNLDQIIASAAREYHQNNSTRDNFGFDLGECQYESYNLIRNQDLCYDRPNTAFCYSLWYHARRVNTFLSHFAQTIFNATENKIEIFDLGAGTGAVQWAIGLVYHAMKQLGMRVPQIRIINVDTSPFMLYYSRDYLWKHFVAYYNHCLDFSSTIEYEVNSWNNNKNISVTNPWLTVSYLFDISDTQNGNNEYRDAVKSGFDEILSKFQPSNILLLTSDQPGKRALLNELKEHFRMRDFIQRDIASNNLLLNGLLPVTSNFRLQLREQYAPVLRTSEAQSIARQVSWTDHSFVGTVLTKRQRALNLETNTRQEEKQTLPLYNPPIVVRRNINLNADQEGAAQNDDRPTIITGPAGCGKSVVITERIKNLCSDRNYDPTLRILVTTFNKQLMSYLGNWLQDILDTTRIKRVDHSFYFNGSTVPNIIMMHFDVLPTRLGNNLKHLDIGYKDYHSALVNECIRDLKREKKITTNEFDKVLNADYVLDEYQRIFYGSQIKSKEEYLAVERKGRRPRLRVEGMRRQLLWNVIAEKYLERIKKESFITKRHRFLKQLLNGEIQIKFSHIFVDEFQDCTLADYEIFYLLLNDPNNLVIAGDIAQAIQLGARLASIPRAEGEMMARRKIHRLKGSYRLPIRISECISNISESIENGNIITPYKGSPPGARPIVVYAATFGEVRQKLQSICLTYAVYALDKVTILETDLEMSMAFRQLKIPSETDTILKLKGLEKTCVIWSTRKDVAYQDEVAEFVYTILSRTSGILIIVLSSQTLPKYHRIINLLRKDRLIFWDQVTKDRFNDFCAQAEEEQDTEED